MTPVYFIIAIVSRATMYRIRMSHETFLSLASVAIGLLAVSDIDQTIRNIYVGKGGVCLGISLMLGVSIAVVAAISRNLAKPRGRISNLDQCIKFCQTLKLIASPQINNENLPLYLRNEAFCWAVSAKRSM